MKKILILITMLFIAGTAATADLKTFLGTVRWTGQNSLYFKAGGYTVAVDPFKLTKPLQADIILLTHSHQDHLSPSDLAKVTNSSRTAYSPLDLSGELPQTVRTLPGFATNLGSLRIEAVPAYNVVKTNRHPKANNWVGYVLTFDGITIYITGDTERVPEMKAIKADAIFLPLGTTYTMNSLKEALNAVLDVKAKIAVPVHYGMFEGAPDAGEQFKKLAEKKGIETFLLKRD